MTDQSKIDALTIHVGKLSVKLDEVKSMLVARIASVESDVESLDEAIGYINYQIDDIISSVKSMTIKSSSTVSVKEFLIGTIGKYWRLNVIEAPVSFSGTAYVSGIKTTGLDSDPNKPWVKCNLGTGACSEEYGPPPDPFPYNEEWFYKDETPGDIHIARAG